MLTFPGLLSNVIACSFRVLHYVATCTVNRQTIEHMLSRASQALLNTLRWIQAQSCSTLQVVPYSRAAQHGNQCAHGRALVSTRRVRELNLNRCVMTNGQSFGQGNYIVTTTVGTLLLLTER